jgi:hypothetical protein
MTSFTLAPPSAEYADTINLIRTERAEAHANAAVWALLPLMPGTQEFKQVAVMLAYGLLLASPDVDLDEDGWMLLAALAEAYDVAEQERVR